MTSGGSESILSAVKASRDYMLATRGVRRPEMVVAESAHAAFFKAAEYFNIKLVKVGARHAGGCGTAAFLQPDGVGRRHWMRPCFACSKSRRLSTTEAG
jgi:hypothetical protein